MSFDSWVGTPTLVLVVPGSAEAETAKTTLGASMAELVRSYRPEVPIRFAYTQGEEHALSEVLVELAASAQNGQQAEGPCDAVVVPLVTDPHQPTMTAIDDAIQVSNVRARVTDKLGLHPMLAEALHLRLAEAGYVRADRMRLISVVAPGDTMADGVVVGSVGGVDALATAGVTAVLLAARLGVTVLPAPLDDAEQLAQVFAQLTEGGCRRPVIAPSVVGQEFAAVEIAALADKHGARASAPLGASSTMAKIVALRYAEELNALGIDQQPTMENLPAPVGSRHRPES